MSIAWLNKIKNYNNIKIVNKNVKKKKNVTSGISNEKTRTSIQMQFLKVMATDGTSVSTLSGPKTICLYNVHKDIHMTNDNVMNIYV